MKSVVSQRSLTRVVDGQESQIEIAQISSVMFRIQSALRGIPDAQRGYIANALLNLAVSKMVKEEGGPRTASLLMRLGDVVANDETAPPEQRAVDLSRTDG